MKKNLLIYAIIIVNSFFFSCETDSSDNTKNSIYSDPVSWAYFPENPTHEIDVFFVAPTVFGGDSVNLNMSLDDSTTKSNFLGAINMEKGIYAQDANFYAPYYRQVGLSAFQIRGYANEATDPDVQGAFKTAYSDVEEAFNYYLTQSDNPFILAGFSQGAEHLIDLIIENFDDPELQQRHIASYAIGWRLEADDVTSVEHLKNAETSDDLGVVICYSSEAENITNSLIVPNTTMSINPLNWTTDTTYASAALNLGACFTNYSGEITKEIPNLTGAYICPDRGTLKVTDVSAADYPPVLSIFSDGEYHIYDYMFFYRNLQENVQTRIDNYKKTLE